MRQRNLIAATIAALLVTAACSGVLQAETVLPSPYWRNTISFPDDPFRAQGPSGEPGWIKFALFVSDQNTVYFQDSNQYPFHYDFAVDLVEEYQGMSPAEFGLITLYGEGQQAILGTVIMPPWTQFTPPAEVVREYGIQLVRLDPYEPAHVVALFNTVKSKITAEPGVQVFYFPTYEQMESALENSAYFEANGITISSPARWAAGNVHYSKGWALGELKFFPASVIENAYHTGALLPSDILLTDGIPAELPFVAGILSLSPSTPNSHVAILANTYGIPFAFLALPEDAARAQQLVGRRIALRAYGQAGNADVRLIDVQDQLNPQQIEEILALKAPPVLNIAPMTPYGDYSTNVDGLWPEDTRYFGGKAAHFGFLRRTVPDNCRVAAAFSFDVWNEYLDQTLWTGRTLRDEIAFRLQGFTYPPENMGELFNTLDGIRQLFRSGSATTFSPALQQAIIDTLSDPQYGLDPFQRIRFRSSSNAEDSEQFTGAGLYNSHSGCLADDLDGDNVGPSHCDPDQPNERGVFRAIKRVFGSFYNDNAYLERLRHGINEADVGMALLVHHSFPDEIEMANGVAILERSGTWRTLRLVTQDGAVSVTNPEGGAIPEEVDVNVYSFGTYLTLVRYSSLVPLGATVLEWEDEYRDLVSLMVAVDSAYGAWAGKTSYTLDFEYKKEEPGTLMLTQVRPLPQPSTTPSITPFLINEPIDYCVFQGEYSNVFANHRLKSQWSIQTRNTWLSPENLTESLYGHTVLEYADDRYILTQTGRPSEWLNASYGFASNRTTDRWNMVYPENPRQYSLATGGVGELVSPAQSPLLTVRDLGTFGVNKCLELRADHAKPVPAWDWPGPYQTNTDHALLCPCPVEQDGDILQQHTLTGPRGESIITRYYWPPAPSGPGAGYTAPLARWVDTVIHGYTSQPITLTSPYAQSYRPEHHNFDEHFIFEPQLDPGVPQVLLNELRAKNIRLFHAQRFMDSTSLITTYGYIVPGDFNHDGRVDHDDLAHFQACVSGPTVPQTDLSCLDADLDRDGDVDHDDFAILQRCFSGPDPANPLCAH